MTVVGSMCSGYGGLDMGLALALGPVEHAWFVEYDKHPSAILAHRFPGVPNYGDVKTTDWTAVERVDWLTAGYPCQPFSHAGKRAGADDPRHLWPAVAHAIGVLRPGNVLLENVAGHVSLGLADVLADLSGLGYDARWGVVRAADAGAPHGRARIFIVATDTRSDDGRERPRLGGVVAGTAGAPTGVGSQRERHGDAVGDSRPVAPDAEDNGFARGRRARDGRHGPADDGGAAPDAAGDGRDERRPEPARLEGRPDAPQRRGADAAHADLAGLEGREPAQGLDLPTWGAYEPAIRRWERVLGRSAPRPTEPGRTGQRLSPRFVEWMMGLPEGWVTDVPGLPRNAQLKALGNGVVPQQCALALRMLAVTGDVAA